MHACLFFVFCIYEEAILRAHFLFFLHNLCRGRENRTLVVAQEFA